MEHAVDSRVTARFGRVQAAAEPGCKRHAAADRAPLGGKYQPAAGKGVEQREAIDDQRRIVQIIQPGGLKNGPAKPPDIMMFGNLPGIVIVLAWLRRNPDNMCDRR